VKRRPKFKILKHTHVRQNKQARKRGKGRGNRGKAATTWVDTPTGTDRNAVKGKEKENKGRTGEEGKMTSQDAGHKENQREKKPKKKPQSVPRKGES